MPSPYPGSFFGILPLGDERVLVYGLQGRLFVSDDAGVTWRELDSRTQATLVDGLRLRNGGLIIVGHAGVVLFDRSGLGNSFELHQPAGRAALASVMELADGNLLLIGEGGVRRLPRERIELP